MENENVALDVVLADDRSYHLKANDILQVIIILRDNGLLNKNGVA